MSRRTGVSPRCRWGALNKPLPAAPPSPFGWRPPSPSSLRPAGLPRAPRLRPRCRPPAPGPGPVASPARRFWGRPAACLPLPCDVARGERETRPQATPKPPRKRDGRATTRENGKAKRERPKRRNGPGPGEPTGRPAHGARRTGGAPETGRAGRQGGGLRTSDPQWHFRAKGQGDGQETVRYRRCVTSGVSITRAILNSILSGNTSNSLRPPPNSTGI